MLYIYRPMDIYLANRAYLIFIWKPTRMQFTVTSFFTLSHTRIIGYDHMTRNYSRMYSANLLIKSLREYHS